MRRYSFTVIVANVVLTSTFLIVNYGLLQRHHGAGLHRLYSEHPVNPSKPYLTRDGDYCVVPYAVTADGSDHFGDAQVTLVTHGSLAYMSDALKQTQLWNGPVSMALFVPSWGLVDNVHLALTTLKSCSADFRRKMSVHILYPSVSSEAGKVDSGQLMDFRCPVRQLQPKIVANYTKCEHATFLLPHSVVKTKNYPVNTARNVARRAAGTALTLVVDVELMPSENFTSMFMEFYQRKHKPKAKEAFVVPVFELHPSSPLPGTKKELYELAKNGRAIPFHSKRIAYECHRMPGFWKWWESGSENATEMNIFSTVRWVRPCWEPVFLSANDAPLYDERFRGYGKNKIQQVYEMCRANYTFHILDNAFFIHYNISVLSKNQWNSISRIVNKNNELFERFRRELDNFYTNNETRTYCDQPVYTFPQQNLIERRKQFSCVPPPRSATTRKGSVGVNNGSDECPPSPASSSISSLLHASCTPCRRRMRNESVPGQSFLRRTSRNDQDGSHQAERKSQGQHRESRRGRPHRHLRRVAHLVFEMKV